MGRSALQIITRRGVRTAEEREYPHDVRAENLRGLDGSLEQFDVRRDFIRSIKVAFEHRRRRTRDIESGVARFFRDEREVIACQILERASEKAADFDAVELELAGETHHVVEFLRDFVGEDGEAAPAVIHGVDFLDDACTGLP